MAIPKDHKGLAVFPTIFRDVQANISNDSNMTKINWDKPKYPETAVLKAEGDIIEGVVTEVSEVRLEDRMAGYLRIQTAKGERTFWLGKVLTEEVVRESVKRGDYVGIKYLGEKPTTKGNPYKDYDMRVFPKEEEDLEG